MSKFLNHYPNYFKNLGKISSKIFSLKIDRYIYDYFPAIYLKFLISNGKFIHISFSEHKRSGVEYIFIKII